MITIIKYAKYVKKGNATTKPIKFRFASKWRIVRPKAKENLYMLYDLNEQFVCSITERVLLKAKEKYEASNKQDQSKGSGKKRVR